MIVGIQGIRHGRIEEVVTLSHFIPEFEAIYDIEEFRRRLDGVPHLILIAEVAGRLAGFKVGYEREYDGTFYSWMGGVLPVFREQGIATQLADRQEAWARDQGYTAVRFKTRNRFKNMLYFALGRGFEIIEVTPAEFRTDNRIWLEKDL
ncbi:MAG: GNAT family N-acetyltransferase [Bacteroidota bacterium]